MSIPCKMNPLGEGRGGERFPLGYKRLEYLENPGRQYIDTKVFPTRDTDFYVDFSIPAIESNGFKSIFSTYISKGNYDIVYSYPNGNTPMLIRVPNGTPPNNLEYGWFKWYPGKRYIVQKKGYKLFLDGELKVSRNTIREFEALDTMTLFVVRKVSTIDTSSFNRAKIFSFVLRQKNTPLRNFIPALDPSGRPCMFDTVTRKPFYNAATTGSDFIAGMTIKQARHLAYLPATGGSLTISLPLAAAFDEKVQNALNKAAEKGWAFTFYWTDVIEYLTPRINAIVGEGNYTIAFDYNAQKVSLAFELSVTSEQVDEVRTLLESELPDNIVVQIEYYTPLEWLYAASKEYIDTGIIHANDIGMIYEVERTSKSDSYLAGVMDENELFSASPARYVPGLNYRPSWAGMSDFGWGTCPADLPLVKTVGSVNFLNNRKATLENEYVSKEQELETLQTGLNWKNWTLFTLHNPPRSWSGRGRIYWAKFSRGNEMIAHFVPALNQEGQPGMYDTVSKVFKTNSGTGDFLYPGAEQAVTTLDLDLDAKSYAKLTEHGVRRLYHVPKGCNMTKDEYAAVNGFKELIEPPMPLEGYWTPQWRETETQLVCDWVETDPPAESLEEP